MAEPKTKPTGASVTAFIDAVENETRRKDAKVLLKIMREATGEKPRLWGASIIGYGAYESPTGPWPLTGFSPRKANMVVYVMPGFAGYDALLARVGKYKTGKSCLYLGPFKDLDLVALQELVTRATQAMREKHGA